MLVTAVIVHYESQTLVYFGMVYNVPLSRYIFIIYQRLKYNYNLSNVNFDTSTTIDRLCLSLNLINTTNLF